MRLGLALVLALLPSQLLADASWQRGADAFVEVRQAAPGGLDRTAPAWPDVARLTGPTDRYDHDVLGGIPRFGVLTVEARACAACRHGRESQSAELPATLVFEDVAPRLWDVTGDGVPEVVVVESDIARGSRLAVWRYADGTLSRLATTAFIGQPHRWLAPVGIGDFDGDGRTEIAYVDRPHLARELVFVRLTGAKLQEVARQPGFTAHRIGDTAITAAARSCPDGRAEVLLPDANWQRLLSVHLADGALITRDLGPMSAGALAAARPCP